MFLEERVEQLSERVTMHDQQIEILSKGLADLTLDVWSVRDDMNQGFKQIDARFDALERDLAGMKRTQESMQKDMASMQETLSLIVKLLTNRV